MPPNFFNPVPAGTFGGRVDDGVDISAAPGTPIFAIAPSQVVYIQQGWYQGQPKYTFKITSGPYAGRYWYAAEQISMSVNMGQSVRGGQQIGVVAPSGTAMEWGWADGASLWKTLAQANGHGGQVPSPEGTDFLNSVIKNSAAPTSRYAPGGPGFGMTRPGGAPADTGQQVDSVLSTYQKEIDLPRTAPQSSFVSVGQAGWTAPFKWWWQSFSGAYQKESGHGAT